MATDVTLPEEKPPEKVEPTNPSPRSTARVDAAAPHIDPSWQTLLFKQLQRFKSYPSGARARNEQGVVILAFTVDRDGHVLSRQIVTGAAQKRFWVKMPAAWVPGAKLTSRRSARDQFLIRAGAVPSATPGTGSNCSGVGGA